MAERKSYKLYIVLFALLICLPWPVWFLLQLFGGETGMAAENRKQSEIPVLTAETYGHYAADVESYYNDRLPFRSSLIELNSMIDYVVFHRSSSDRVLLGKDRWLFYSNVTDGDPIASYEGRDSYSEEDLAKAAEVLKNTEKRLKDKGINLAVIVPDNKERVYHQFMPDSYHFAETSRTDILCGHLRAAGFDVVTPAQEIEELQDLCQLYYTYDTHWNELGGYVGAIQTMEHWGFETVPLQERTIGSHPLKDRYHLSGMDDLANMLSLRELFFDDELEYFVEDTPRVDWDSISDGLFCMTNPKALHAETLFIVGDSFRVAMLSEFSEQFATVYAVHRNHYEPEMLDEIQPEYLLLEYVERTSSNLLGVEKLLFDGE